MTISEQAAIVLEAFEHGVIRVEGVVRWADSRIIADENSSSWLIDLSTHSPQDITGFQSLLRTHAAKSLPLRWRVQIIVLGVDAGLLSVAASLPLLFRVLILERLDAKRDPADEQLVDALIEWDFQDKLSAISAPLHARFEGIFRQYLADADGISAVLQLGHEDEA